MDLILWRHAEAHEAAPGEDDMSRSLTPRGERQAIRMAQWLERQLPEGTRILCSPAKRTEQTVMALGRKYKLSSAITPQGTADMLLTAAQWPTSKHTVLVIGHQPILGEAISIVLGFQKPECSVKKGAVWWLRSRLRQEGDQSVLVTVQTPDML
jgi:phosphohistidine phosphatase